MGPCISYPHFAAPHADPRTSAYQTYCATRFVTKPKKGKGKNAQPAQQRSATPPSDAAPTASLHTANGLQTGVSTPLPSGSGSPTSAAAAAKAAAAQLLERGEPDGAVINCLAVSEIVCKIGRITVPPALVYAVDGFCRSGAEAYSRAHPPPHWAHVQRLLGASGHAALDDKRGLRAMRAFLAGGWRDVPEGERWWEDALGGEVEERRLRGLGAMHALRKGLEEARTI